MDYEETINASVPENIEQANDEMTTESGIDPKLLGLGAAALVGIGGMAWAKREVLKEKVRARRERKLEAKKARLAKKLADLNKATQTPGEEAETK